MNKKFKRIVLHWTAGAGSPSSYDRLAYHYLIDVKGNIHNGVYPPEANLDTSDGVYAAHTGGGNTGAIGVALCGMAGFTYPKLHTPHPISKPQLEAAFSFVAKLCRKYSIEVKKDTVLTHYEFGLMYPESTSKGKIDIVYMPPYPAVHKYQVGNFIRNKVQWYIERSNSK